MVSRLFPTKRQRRVYGDVRASAPARVVPRPPVKPPRGRFRFLDLPVRVYLKAAALIIGGSFVIGSGIVLWVSRDLPDPNKLNDRQVAQSTKIYDRSGEHLLYEIYQNQKRTIVEMSEISPWVSKATIAVEDKYFYQHRGIRVASILRAGFNNLIGRRAGSGGASTLTQQLIKNAIVGDKRSYWRKVKEAILALRLERKYSKDDILKLYLNEIPYGSTNYGVEAAAQSYFHVKAKDLTLPEAATLAGLAKAPSRYLNNLEALKERRDVVLRLMFEQGYITEEEKASAQETPLKIFRSTGIFDAPHFVLYVKQLLADQFGEQLVDTGGLKVITTLDYDKQKLAEKIVKEQGDKFAKEANANNAALLAMDPKTGEVLAMVGSRDFANEEIDGQFNVAVLGKRQPGSSFKPFVYAAAFAKGYTPDTVLYDVKTDFDLRGGAKYTPKNFDGKEYGLVTLRKALQGSLNIPAVKVMYLVGEKETVEFAKRFGYTTFTGDYGLSLVLGGGEVNLLEHTNAYATLANNGVHFDPSSILKVADARGNTLFEKQPAEGTEAVAPELAALTTSVLSDNNARAFIFGVNNNLVLPDRPAAAKTGTTNDSKDAWTLGYVPSLAAGVWVGNTIPKPMKAGGNKLAGVIWNQFMRQALKDKPVEQFATPPVPNVTKPILRGSDGGVKLPINTVTGRIATSSTPPELIVEKTYLPPHDILYYVEKDNPAGDPPAFPGDDPQYENWERALQDWVRRQQEAGKNMTLEEPISEYDIPASLELAPRVTIVSPAANSTIDRRQFDIKVEATAPRGVSKVLYYIDGTAIGASQEFPFQLNYDAAVLARGAHKLRVIAQDDIGTSAAAEADFVLEPPLDPPEFNWVDATPLIFSSDQFPRAMYLNQWRWDDIKDVKIYLASGSGEKLIYTFNHAEDKLFNNQLFFTWRRSPGNGEYVLKGVMTDNEGRVVERKLSVTVK